MKHRDLGMDRRITRRDFVNGVAVAISGSLAWRWTEAQARSGAYPPVLTGMRGSHQGSYEVAHAMRDGARWDRPEDTGEAYDLVVVGAGLSGLAAAWYYREAEPDARILILDNHDDFGGHAKRNEFWMDDRMILSHGGTENIQDLRRYNAAGRRLLESIGIDVARYSEFHDESIYNDHGLGRSVFLDRETFGSDKLLVDEGQPSWREYFSRTPLSEKAQDDLVRLHEADIDYFEDLGLEEKTRFLQKTSYEDFLRETVGVGPEAVAYLWRSTTWATGIDAISAWVAAGEGWPGTAGLQVSGQFETAAVPSAEALYCQFPDGNATIARLIVRSLVPGVANGSTLDDVVTARFDYDALDAADSPTRVRLNSTVVNVRHSGDLDSARDVKVTYVQDGRAFQVRGGRCVLACYNAAIPHICDEMPASQQQALSQAAKAPLIYTNVLLGNWTALANLGIRYARCPGSYMETVRLTEAVSIGGYRHSSSPEEPVVLRMGRAPLLPELRGRPVTEQWRAARAELLETTFETFEMKIRDQLGRMLGVGGFDPERDIRAITVNRWPHGYAYGLDPATGQVAWMLDELPPERSPWLMARKPFGRIAIANSDATADAMTEGAFRAAQLAIDDLLATVDATIL
ncbi:MAG: NAD(P)-binding protein [Proteobacteria bacterium]|nr:NAD(P)-binding protein [Pseudomonadota bacterium]MDA1063626.1 NAD(P)-binding protein [Pseudomonadota bacterium]